MPRGTARLRIKAVMKRIKADNNEAEADNNEPKRDISQPAGTQHFSTIPYDSTQFCPPTTRTNVPPDNRRMTPRTPRTDAEWEAYRDLRWRVLRAPWGQPRAADVDEDIPTVHALITDDRGRAVAAGRLLVKSPVEAQVRSMATAEDMRGQGLGRRIMEYLEQAARDAGVASIVLHARLDAVPFYARLGYKPTGPGPTLYGCIPHTAMRKQLS